MFVVPPQPEEGDLKRVRRKSSGADRLTLQGWAFLPENRSWDADERELVARSTGLFELSAEVWLHESDAWFKAFARSYVRTKHLGPALGDCVAISEEAHDMAKRKPPAAGNSSEGPVCRRLTSAEIEELRRWGKEGLEKAKAYFRDYDR